MDNDDFLDGNKDDNQQEVRQRMMDGILLPPVTLLRRIGGGLLQTGTKNDGGGASEDDNIEDDIWVGRLRVVVDRQQGRPGRKGNYGGRQQDGARHRNYDVLLLHNSISL